MPLDIPANISENLRPHLPMDLTIIGLGGCGKTLLHKISEHDWFIKQYLSDLDSRLGLYTIDTAMNEHEDDLHAMFHVRERIDKIRSQDFESTATGVINCKHLNLSEMANIQEIQDMTGHDVVDRLHLADENKVWWLHDPEHGINFSELAKLDLRLKSGFKGGVYRMRAVSKAAFTIAYQAHQGQFVDLINNVRGTTAIIVGLGGGTGSGMFIDLAKKIREHKPDKEICLFAILPSSCEGQDEQLNAAVALTELEYLNVANPPEGKIFDHVILTTLEDTHFTTIEVSRSSQDVLDFDNAFPYLFVNTLSDYDYSVISSALDYGGFIHAAAHVIEYPIDKLHTFEDIYDSYLNDLSEITAIRKSICDNVVEFFEQKRSTYSSEYEHETTDQSMSMSDISKYRENIKWVKRLWENDGAMHLGLNTPGEIENILNEYLPNTDLNELSFNYLKNYVSTIKVQMAPIRYKAETWIERDTQLFNCIYDNLDILEKTGEYYTITSCLCEPESQKVHMAIMSLDSNVDELSHLIQRRISELSNDSEYNMILIQSHKTQIDDIHKILDKLYAQKKVILENPADSDDGIKILNNLITDINSEVEATKQDIRVTVSQVLGEIQEYCNLKMEKPKIFGRKSDAILNNIISSLSTRFHIEWKSNELVDAIRNSDPTPEEIVDRLSCTTFDIIDKLHGWTKRLCEHENMVYNRVHALADDISREIAIEISKLDSLSSELNELEISISMNSSKIEYLLSIDQELLMQTRDKYFECKDLIIMLREPNVLEVMSRYENRHYRSVLGNLSPEILPTITQNSTLDNLSMTKVGQTDIARITNILNSQYLELLNSATIGMSALTISQVNDISRRWSINASALTISSQSHLLGERINDVDPNTKRSFAGIMMRRIDEAMHGMERCSFVLHNGAKPWECGISLMATGNYLENILGFQRGGCYWMAYEKSKDNILHHVLGLENGEYLTRDLLSPDQAMELAYAEKHNPSDEQSMHAIMSLHHTKRIVDVLPEAE